MHVLIYYIVAISFRMMAGFAEYYDWLVIWSAAVRFHAVVLMIFAPIVMISSRYNSGRKNGYMDSDNSRVY
jgi:hypothetical protein